MAKRAAESGNAETTALKAGNRPGPGPDHMDTDDARKDKDMGDFEDEFEDEFDSDDEILEAGVDGRPDAEREAEEKKDAMELDTFIIGRNKLEPGQVLQADMSSYEILFHLSTPWPCLSFDIIRDGLGDKRSSYPATMYTVAGTQADSERSRENQLIVMKLSGLSKLDHPDESDGEDEDDDDNEDADPILESVTIPISSTIKRSTTNRIRAHQVAVAGPPQDLSGSPPLTFTATMTESSQVLIHDISPHLAIFDSPGTVITAKQNDPVHTITTHRAEGYAVDWSPLAPAGKLLTGDNDGLIYLTSRADGGRWTTESRPFQGHTGSVEDIQWSPSEQSVFASASSDGTVRVWDLRFNKRALKLTVQASQTDVNVMSWSRLTTHLLATGADDGVFAVWDLRQWKGGSSAEKSTPLASFDYHKKQVTSIEWHPADDSIIAVAAGDNKVTLWDLSAELDDEESKHTAGVKDMPPQLLFEHHQNLVKEVHWHPQIVGSLVATGEKISVFRTISV